MARLLAVVTLCALVLPAAAAAAPPAPKLPKKQAIAIFLAHPKVANWLERYPEKGRQVDAERESALHDWKVMVWWGDAGEIALGRVTDDRVVTEAWTGPQVAWKMARGGEGAFGGKTINSLPVWLGFCAAFLAGLVDWRRLRSVRNLDLLVLLSFSVSLWYFNDGDIFTSVPLAYPPLVYLLARMLWTARRDRPPRAGRPVWPVWLLAAATVFLMGFRIGLNVEASNVIDVGYAGVIGAERISSGEMPYGHMPIEDDLKPCGPADIDGEIRDRIQTNGRCESANERGDTYGPVSYYGYLPGYWALGWSGKWDDLPAAHFASIAFDVLALLGLALVGRRYGGNRLAATLGFAWAAYPFTQYVSSSNTNDSLMPALLVVGFWLASSAPARGAFAALAGWTKFGALVLAPLWLTYPRRRLRPALVCAAAFAVATLVSFWLLLLEPSPVHAARVFWDRTIGWQIDRDSPFSLWDWGQYHAAGIPDLKIVQRVLEAAVLLGAVVVAFVPRVKSPLRLAALTAALLLGVELVLTHWFYLYIPWFFPFVACALLWPAAGPRPAPPAEEPRERDARTLVPAG